MDFQKIVAANIVRELRDDPEQENFYAQVQISRKVINRALALHNVNMERAAVAAYGGLVKRWRRWLIEQLTDVALANCDTSRDAVRAWQKRIFGQAVASSRLARYANPERSGSGRATGVTVPPHLEDQISEFYEANKNKIKEV